MQRFLTSIFAFAFAASLGTSAFAQGTMATSAPAMSGAAATSSKTCPAGETWVKGYTKSDGTKVAGYCRAAKAPATTSKACPKGETWVKGYTKSDGTKVDGYCRSKSKSSSSMSSSSMSSSSMKSMASPAPAATK
jgi:hypothetical protein